MLKDVEGFQQSRIPYRGLWAVKNMGRSGDLKYQDGRVVVAWLHPIVLGLSCRLRSPYCKYINMSQ